MLHVSIKAEEIFNILGFPLTNSLLASYIVLALFLLVAVIFNSKLKQKKSKFVFFILFIVNGLYSMFLSILKDNTKTFFPILASFLLYILLSNWFGLIPGVGSVMIKKTEAKTQTVEKVIEKDTHTTNEENTAKKEEHGVERVPILRAGTADLNMTVALGLISFVLIQFFGIRYVGIVEYSKKFINLSNPIAFFTGILEIVSEFSKIISFAFRLFGNIFAGEVLLAVVAFLVPVLASFPFLMLEIFVGFIQALVFSMLTAVFLSMSISKHH